MSSKIKNSLKNMWSWMTSSSNPITRLWNDYTGNTSIDKQLAHQQAENEATREYNLQLAEKQNNWNIQQWQRENEYNSPSAQKARLEAAGLNPDLMYGAGGVMNTSASSPQMTAGAPASPTDWTSLGRKKTIGEAVMDSLVMRQAEANIRKTNAEAGIQESDLSVRDKLNEIGIDVAKNTNEKIMSEIESISTQARLNSNNADLAAWNHEMQKKFGENYIINSLEKLSAEMHISKDEAQLRVQTLAERVLGLQAESRSLQWTANVTNSEWGIIIEILKRILPSISLSKKLGK